MKRACILFIAVLFALLIYPSTHPSASTPKAKIHKDGPTVVPTVPSDEIANTNDDDDGDADDLGIKGESRGLGSSGSGATSPVIRFLMWWKYFMWWK